MINWDSIDFLARLTKVFLASLFASSIKLAKHMIVVYEHKAPNSILYCRRKIKTPAPEKKWGWQEYLVYYDKNRAQEIGRKEKT